MSEQSTDSTDHSTVEDGESSVPDVRVGEQGRTVGHPTIVLVQCTGQKRDEPAKARVLYDKSDLFRKQRAYARKAGDEWYIQSAEHGLVDPESVLEPYDTHARLDMTADERQQWAYEIARDISHRVAGNATVEILGGKHYANPLTPELECRGIDVKEPLRGLGIGKRKRALMDMAAELEGSA